MPQSLSHLNAQGQSRMVDISSKEVSARLAVAQARVSFPPEIYQQIQKQNGKTAKGTICEVARLAGIMAAKNTASLIPLCHPLMIEACDLEFEPCDASNSLLIRAKVTVSHKTGVEMEALTAVSVAALAVYDMCKALSHDILISDICLLAKTGGQHDFKR